MQHSKLTACAARLESTLRNEHAAATPALAAFAEALEVVVYGLASLNLEARLPPDSAATTTLVAIGEPAAEDTPAQ